MFAGKAAENRSIIKFVLQQLEATMGELNDPRAELFFLGLVMRWSHGIESAAMRTDAVRQSAANSFGQRDQP